MNRYLLLVTLIFVAAVPYAQEVAPTTLRLKKHNRVIRHYYKDTRITFRTADGSWISGIIKRLTNDSFGLTRETFIYNIGGVDTLHMSGYVYAIQDIDALPTKNEMVVNSNWQVKVIPGHEKFLWVRNGFIFKVVGAGYGVINVTNSLIDDIPPFNKKNLPRLVASAGLVALGFVLHATYRSELKIGRKYQLEVI